MPLTILDLAVNFGAKADANGRISADQFYQAGFEIVGGCQTCGASIAAYHAFPSRTGYWKCGDCIGEHGFKTVQEYIDFMKGGKG